MEFLSWLYGPLGIMKFLVLRTVGSTDQVFWDKALVVYVILKD